MRSWAAVLLLLFAAACSGEDDRQVRPATRAAQSAPKDRWRFVDAFEALRSRDPARRLDAVNWIARNLGTHRALARDALRVAAFDEAPEVSARARQVLEVLGERIH
jgi:hypothetical protein